MTSKPLMLARLNLGVLMLCGCSTIMGYEERGIRKEGSSGAEGAVANSASIAGNSGAFNEPTGGFSSAAHGSSSVRNTAGGGLATSVAPGLGGAPVSPASSLGGALGTTTGVVATGGIVAMGGSTTAGSAPVGPTTGGNAPVATAKGGNAPVAKGGNAPVGPTTGGNAPVTTGGTAPVGSTRGSAASVGSTTGGVAPAGGSTTTARTNCSAANVFCDSFEQGTFPQADAGKSWSGEAEQAGDGWIVATETGAGLNATKGLHLRFSGATKEGEGAIYRIDKHLVGDLGLTPNGTIQIEFDFYFSGAEFNPLSLFCDKNDYELSFTLDGNTFGQNLSRNTSTVTGDRIPLTESVSFAQWRHLRVRIDTSTKMLSMEVDGKPVLAPTRLSGNLSECKLDIGVLWASHSHSFDLDAYFDNVRIEVN